MHGNANIRICQFNGFDGVINSHSKIITDWQEHIVYFIHFSDQFHIIKKSRISRMINYFTLYCKQHPRGFPGIISCLVSAIRDEQL